MAHGSNWRTFPGDIPGWELRLHDPYTHAYTFIDSLHRQVHDGMVFNYTHKFLTMVNGATVKLVFAPPARCWPHMNRMLLNVGKGDIDIVWYKNPTITDYGTTVPAGGKPNTNQNSSNVANLAIHEEVTTSADGTSIHRTWIPPTGTGVGSTVGVMNVGAGEEWMLTPGVEYLMAVTNGSGATIDMSLDVLWYELSYENV